MDDATLSALLDEHAPWRPTSLVPSLSAWHAPDELPLWQALEAAVGARIDPPFFAVAWPGAQALARAIDDGALGALAGSSVVDVGAGSGLASAAAARAGASVVALELDPLAARVIPELARRNGVLVEARVADALTSPGVVPAGSVVLAGDLVYGAEIASAFARALDAWRARACAVFVADSGRPFFDAARFGLTPIVAYDVETPRALDGAAVRRVVVYR